MLKTFLRLKNLHVALILLVFGLGLGIRLYDLTDPPLDFHPARQYHSAVIARGIYTHWGGAYPEELAQRHRAQEASEARIEPPIFEYLVAANFKLFRTDALWIARLYAILFWMAGGIPLYLLAKRLAGFEAGLLALGVYLLIPFGVLASRSFQPDPLMVTLTIYAIWALDRWQQQPTWRRALLAGALLGAAILVKQVMIMPLGLALAGLLWVKWGWRALRSRHAWAMAALSVFPALAYNLYGVFISGALAGQYSQRFFPHLWMDPGFYIRWSNMIQAAIGLPLFLLGLAGLLLLREKASRGLLFGYLLGYLVYGFVFSHHISTHDYYQLPLLPLVAMGVGLAGEVLFREVRNASGRLLGRAGVAVVLLAATLLSLWSARSSLRAADYRQDPALLVELTEQMGGPRASTLGLMEDYGAALYYYAYNLPVYWYLEEDGVRLNHMSPSEMEAAIKRRFEGKEFFIITDLDVLRAQPAVQHYLDRHYDILYEDSRYLVYDLRTAP